MDIDEAMPYLLKGAKMSTQALAMLIIGCNHCIDDVKLPMEQVQFPARCISSEEHMLVTGLLVQLGTKEVKRAVVVNRLKLDVVPSVAIRVLIFRDQVTEPWNQVHEAGQVPPGPSPDPEVVQ